MHHAVVVDERLAVVPERGRGDRTTRCVHHARRVPQVKDLVEHRGHLRRREGQRSGHPLVVDVRAVHAQHQVLDPVGERPTGRRTGLDTDTERRVAIGDHVVRQGLQVVPGPRHGIALLGKLARLVPDQRLQVRLGRNPVLGTVDVAEGSPGRRPVRLHGGDHVGRQRQHPTLTGEVGQLAGLGEHEDVRRIATGSLRVDLIRRITGTRVADLDPRLRSKDVQGIPKRPRLLIGTLRTKHRNRRPGQWCSAGSLSGHRSRSRGRHRLLGRNRGRRSGGFIAPTRSGNQRKPERYGQSPCQILPHRFPSMVLSGRQPPR